jgi:predicted ATPase
MLKNISATNFRSFRSLDVDLAPITLFVGPNNSGKSSIVSVIRLLSQTLESNDPNVRLLLNGALGDFGTYKDLIHGNETRKHLDVSFTLQPGDNFRVVGSDRRSITFHLHYKYRSALKEVILKRLECEGDGRHHLTAEFNEDSERFLIRRLANTDVSVPISSSGRLRGFDVRNFLPRFSVPFSEAQDDFHKLAYAEARAATRNAHAVARDLQAIEYVGAMRVPPSRTYLYTGERRQKVGANGEHAVTMLAMDSIRRGSKSRGIRQGVVKWLSLAGIASDIKILPLSDRYFEIHVQHPITKEYENFADVGYGNSQVVPVLVAGLNTSAGDCFIVEEPEIHLHPKAQAELGDFFLDLSRRGVQSIVETHSEHMIVRLQKHIAAGELDPKSVYIYYVNPTPTGKEVIRLEIDSKGVFKQQWPGGFFPERLKEARELAAARARPGVKDLTGGDQPELPI